MVLERGLNVRDVERLAQLESREADGESTAPVRQARRPDADTRALEVAIQEVLGLVVKIDHRGTAGELRIKYRSLDQLDALCRRLRDQPGVATPARPRDARAKRA